jgi:hypothetical protein
MLLDRALGLTEKIGRYQKLKTAALQAQMYKTRALQLEQARNLLAVTQETIRQFDEVAIHIDFEATNADLLLSNATSLRDMFMADPGVLASPPFDLKFDFIDRISGLADFARIAIEKAWRSYVEGRAVIGSSEVLDALMRLPQFRASVLSIKACNERINRLAAQVQPDLTLAVENLNGHVQELRSAWATISAEGIPDTVIQFLRASAAEGVPLDMLTDETCKWLESRGLLNAFRVRIG